MNANTLLLEKQAEIKITISKGIENTIPAYFFNLVGRGLKEIFHLEAIPHWLINATVLLAIVLFPGSLAALITKEFIHWGKSQWFYFGLIPFAYMSSVTAHINLTYNILPGIRDYIIDSIHSIDDLENLKNWLSEAFSFRKWLFFSIGIGILVAILFVIGLNLSGVQYLIGLTILTFSVAPFFIAPVYILFNMLTLPVRLANYHLDLYELDPANSEIIQHLLNILNIYLYVVVGYVTTGTTFSAINPNLTWWLWGCLLFGWIPTILQFLVNQYSIRKMIIASKWQSLKQLQVQIKELRNSNLLNGPDTTITRLNQLMDLHDRISAKPNSVLNWGSGLSFLNQLMLPLLGLLLGNIDKLLKLLNP